MRVNKAYKYRIYPNEEQKEKLNKTFGCVRFVWNKFVESFNDTNKPNYTKYNDLASLFPFLKDVSAGALQQHDLHRPPHHCQGYL
jgi:putative transposase